jgi:hypothetical protein
MEGSLIMKITFSKQGMVSVICTPITHLTTSDTPSVRFGIGGRSTCNFDRRAVDTVDTYIVGLVVVDSNSSRGMWGNCKSRSIRGKLKRRTALGRAGTWVR